LKYKGDEFDPKYKYKEMSLNKDRDETNKIIHIKFRNIELLFLEIKITH